MISIIRISRSGALRDRDFRESYPNSATPKFKLSPELYLALAILNQEFEPKLFLIPSEAWKKPNKLLVDRNYEGKKSKPEWGLNISNKNMNLLEKYSFSRTVSRLQK